MVVNESVFDNFEFGKAMIHSLEQAVAFKNGDNTKIRTVVRAIPTPEYKAPDIVRVRQKYHLSQRGLALTLNVSPRTVEAWESGKNKPAGPSSKLLYLLEKDARVIHELIC
jgi:putative transcriptional regulator